MPFSEQRISRQCRMSKGEKKRKFGLRKILFHVVVEVPQKKTRLRTGKQRRG